MKRTPSPKLPTRISIYGTGRVATALLRMMEEAGIPVKELLGRSEAKLRDLGARYRIERSALPEEADPEVELLLLAVSDDAIGEAVERLPEMEGVIAHCSGVMPLSVLKGKGRAQGILYPVQSFSGTERPAREEIPFCIEGSDEESEKLLEALGEKLSGKVHRLGGEERKYLHLGAVLACNLTNHLYGKARELLQEKELPFELLHALILHTARKAVSNDPYELQTGPAVRADRETLRSHLELLEGDPELQNIYRTLTQSILRTHHGTDEL